MKGNIIIMKKKIVVLLASVLLLTNVSIANAVEYTFGVVDMNAVMEKTLAAKSIIKQIDEKKKTFSTAIDAKEKELRAEEQKLIDAKAKLSEDEFGKKREGFKQDVIEGHKLAQKNKMILDKGFSIAMNKFRSNVMAAINEIATEKKYSAIFMQNSLMMASPELDVTELLIKKLDAKVKEIKVDWAEASKIPNNTK